jgi:polyisoprenoid-binding protein YceI
MDYWIWLKREISGLEEGILLWGKTYPGMSSVKFKSLFVFIALLGCRTGDLVNDKEIFIGNVSEVPRLHFNKSSKKAVDITNSIIEWKGTKLMYTRKHSGVLKLKGGELFYDGEELVGGFIIADMKSIKVTDMPAHETIPFTNLTNHLNSDFNVQKYPTATFEITRVDYQKAPLIRISGKMTIREVSSDISFLTEIRDGMNKYEAELTIDRTIWNIGIEGSWLEKKLVDNEIELKIQLLTK